MLVNLSYVLPICLIPSGNLPAGMAFQQDSAMVKLEIRDLTATRTLSQASLGEMVVLYAELINTASKIIKYALMKATFSQMCTGSGIFVQACRKL